MTQKIGKISSSPIEAMRFAYSARLELGDPAFIKETLDMETRMLDEETARLIHGRIMDNQTQPVEYYNPKKLYTSDTEGTSHIVTADASGMATSMTSTVNLLFGAHTLDPITGIIINNEMNDFSIPGARNEFGYMPPETMR